ncbi:MAG: dNTP triphosphohydrolase [Deltaproteobacteria bacterium]|nr:dNTP triphosphohydrolase [Deltaproteobacteria bacterium]
MANNKKAQTGRPRNATKTPADPANAPDTSKRRSSQAPAATAPADTALARPTQVKRTDRRHSEGRPDGTRTAFKRDRDRVLYSDAFRRLAGVTQVVHAAEGHGFHNRLTHSLKVAQVGRRVAERLATDVDLSAAAGGIDPDVVETASLAHDLGHPPFGHIAEEELHAQIQAVGVEDGFEGNAQSFRIVTRAAIRSNEHLGLNLTRASLNAILKYPWAHGAAGKKSKKWGHFFSETEDFNFARQMTPGEKQSNEASLMDWADDITYAVHDVEDFYRVGTIPLDRLLSGKGPERVQFIDAAVARWAESEQVDPAAKDKANRFFDLLGPFIPDELRSPYSGTRAQRAALNQLSSMLITRFVLAINFVEAAGSVGLRFEEAKAFEVKTLKSLMVHYVYRNPALVAQQFGQRRVVAELFKILFDAAKPGARDAGVIPMPYRDLLDEVNRGGPCVRSPEDQSRERARLVADIIASLTEQQALEFHQRLAGISPGSVLESIIR